MKFRVCHFLWVVKRGVRQSGATTLGPTCAAAARLRSHFLFVQKLDRLNLWLVTCRAGTVWCAMKVSVHSMPTPHPIPGSQRQGCHLTTFMSSLGLLRCVLPRSQPTTLSPSLAAEYISRQWLENKDTQLEMSRARSVRVQVLHTDQHHACCSYL